MVKYLWITLGLFLLSATVIAQEAVCPNLERAAVAESRVWCSELEQGQACYGNSGVSADVISETSFTTVGDIAPLTDITQLATISGENRYGIALVQTTGYSPDSWQEGQISLALLGDVTLANTGNEGINLATIATQITSESGANVRSGPTTEYRLIQPLFENDLIKLTGRLDDNSAYRVQLPSGENGWLTASAVDAGANDLPVVSLENTPPQQIYAPYTSFSLRTGFNDAGCADSWQSGVLLQSQLASENRVRVNDLAFLVSGTVFLQADDDDTVVHVIEGQVSYQDETVSEGYTLAISAESAQVFPYDIANFAPLPTEILPRYAYIGLDLTTIITPAPTVDRSPIADVLVSDPCVLTTGQTGANLRAGPASDFPIRGVLAFRETVNPVSRVTGSNGAVWYELAQNVWVTGQVVVTGGDCISVPQAERIPAPLPTATPEN